MLCLWIEWLKLVTSNWWLFWTGQSLNLIYGNVVSTHANDRITRAHFIPISWFSSYNSLAFTLTQRELRPFGSIDILKRSKLVRSFCKCLWWQCFVSRVRCLSLLTIICPTSSKYLWSFHERAIIVFWLRFLCYHRRKWVVSLISSHLLLLWFNI